MTRTTGRAWILVLLMGLSGCRWGIPEPESLPNPPVTLATWQVETARENPGATDLLVLDVRTPGEFALGHIEGAVNIPSYALASRLPELLDYKTRTGKIIVYCEAGVRSKLAAEYLIGNGWLNTVHYVGGMRAWRVRPQGSGG